MVPGIKEAHLTPGPVPASRSLPSLTTVATAWVPIAWPAPSAPAQRSSARKPLDHRVTPRLFASEF